MNTETTQKPEKPETPEKTAAAESIPTPAFSTSSEKAGAIDHSCTPQPTPSADNLSAAGQSSTPEKTSAVRHELPAPLTDGPEAPISEAPTSVSPASTKPGRITPRPEASNSEIHDPKTLAPKASNSHVCGPIAPAPKAPAPATSVPTEPDRITLRPETSIPEAYDPKALAPKASELQAGSPENPSPKAAGPQTSIPEAANQQADVPLAPTPDERRRRVFDFLDAHGIRYTWYTHPEAPTCEIALRYCRGDGARHCKNLFFRNHKGDRHYLVCFDAERQLAIRELEQRLRQGKLSFASPARMERRLGLPPGSVSPFGLINDAERHVHLFLDTRMRTWKTFAFHPNDNRATVVISRSEFFRYLAAVGNSYEFVELY